MASCPQRESGNVEELEERIETMEEELEVGSRDVKEERAVSSNGFFVISLAKTGLVKVEAVL